MPNYKVKEDKQVPYSKEELDYMGDMRAKIVLAKEMRDSNHDEFDGMTYLEYYESNAKAARSFVPPKLNEEDTRIVTGTTEEKVDTMLSAVLSYNFEANFEAFDKDNEIIDELGETIEDLVRKSREIENYDDTRKLVYKEGLDQGDAFVEETWYQPSIVEKTMKQTLPMGGALGMMTYQWTEKIKTIQGEAKVNQIDGRNFFFGQIRIFDLDKQPFIFTRECIPYTVFEKMFAGWERTKFVPCQQADFVPGVQGTQDTYNNWTLYDFRQEMVEIIKMQNRWTNEYMIWANGVMMLPIHFPLSAVNGVDENGQAIYNIARVSINPIAFNFAYSKSVPAKTKIKQAVADELLKLMILKTQQSFKPPLANNSDRELTQRVFMPAQITDNVDPDSIKPIIPANGVTPSEFNFYSLIKEEINAASVSNQFSGNSDAGTQTATEVIELRRQNMMKLGSTLWGIMSFEHRLNKLRALTILRKWTEPIDERVDPVRKELQKMYRKVQIDNTAQTGSPSQKIINFSTESVDEFDLLEEASKKQQKTGRKTAIIVLNPEVLAKLQYQWKIVIVPTEKDTTALDRELLFNDTALLQKIFEPKGIQLNYEYLKKEFALAMKKDVSKLFATSPDKQIMDMAAQGAPEEEGANPLDGILRNPVGKQVAENIAPRGRQMPAVKTLANS